MKKEYKLWSWAIDFDISMRTHVIKIKEQTEVATPVGVVPFPIGDKPVAGVNRQIANGVLIAHAPELYNAAVALQTADLSGLSEESLKAVIKIIEISHTIREETIKSLIK